METFGEHLRRFALAIDIVSPHVFETAFKAAATYLREAVSVVFCELLAPMKVNGQPGLTSVFHPGGGGWSKTIRDHSGQYQGQISYAYDVGAALWIVGASRCKLAHTTEYVNLLAPDTPPSPPLPRYEALAGDDIQTSVMYPLFDDGDRIGILNFESTDYLTPVNHLRSEFRRIADAISLLYALHRNCNCQTQNTHKALEELTRHKATPLVGERRVFLASAVNADDGVIGEIRRVFSEFDVEVQYWKEDGEPGDIQTHIWRKLSTSELGVCYFSEPAAGSQFMYRDNANVLFEAGMMYAMVRTLGVMSAWIPIREHSSPPLPFNFATERALFIPRSGGHLNTNQFREELRQRLREAKIPMKR
jgi:hypothetical protein